MRILEVLILSVKLSTLHSDSVVEIRILELVIVLWRSFGNILIPSFLTMKTVLYGAFYISEI